MNDFLEYFDNEQHTSKTKKFKTKQITKSVQNKYQNTIN